MLFHFYENPIVISIVIGILILVSFGSSRDIIIVKGDHFLILYKRVLPVFSSTKKFYFLEIKEIEADLPLTRKSDIAADLVTATTPLMMIVLNKLSITYKDGHIKKITTNVYRDALHEAFTCIQKVSKINIVINDIN